MSPLTPILAERIAQHGPLPFANFMEAALYHPVHGYYASGRAGIGRQGDYFTNVSVGPLFGVLLMRQFAEMWRLLERPANFRVVEQGAHHGHFARDVLEAAHRLEPEFAKALCYTIIEDMPVQKIGQRVHLAPFGARVTWVNHPSDLPPFTGVHFSNELIDAFPVHVVSKAGSGEWRECTVEWQDERFVWSEEPITWEATLAALEQLPEEDQRRQEAVPSYRRRVAQLAQLPADLASPYRTEIHSLGQDWIGQVAAKLERGWVLAIDYGYPRAEYYRPERSQGTLSAYAHHQRVDDLLQDPGEVDLTVHVDFTTLAEHGEAAGLRLCGFADQHHFMVGLSGLHFADTEEISPERQKEMRAFQTLMHPNLMGASFKVLGLERRPDGEPATLSGFRFAGDGRAKLGLG